MLKRKSKKDMKITCLIYKTLRCVALLTVVLSCHLSAKSQIQPVLSFDKFMEQVQSDHPVAAAASLQIDRGEALLQTAKGGFDPVLAGNLSRKDFEGKRYYDLVQGGLKVPTWLGLTFDAGFTENEGVFLNPENNTPQTGLVHAGVKLSLGRGMFIDERRAELKKAQIASSLVQAERDLMLNDLMLNAGSAYWKWFAAYHNEQVFAEATELAKVRLEGVKQSAIFGDKPFIDTLEASIQFQTRTLSWEQAKLETQNASAEVAIYLWMDGFIPLEIDPNTVPLDLNNPAVIGADPKIVSELDTLLARHPEVLKAQFKIDQLDIDRRWKAEQLKPQVDLKYNALTESLGGVQTGGFNEQDFTFGVDVKVPIFLRKERGGLQLAKIKIEESQLKLLDKQQSIWLKARMALNDQSATARQVEIFEETVVNYGKLLDGERDLFNSGESSLFLVNSREVGYLQTRVKLIELIAKNQMAGLKASYSISQMR
ncbi:MAG: TolC family protein [Flavobacteriales bacterium]